MDGLGWVCMRNVEVDDVERERERRWDRVPEEERGGSRCSKLLLPPLR